MNCSKFRTEMNNFIYNTMDEEIMEDFINHYKECSQCNEELEIYYMINKTFNDNSPNGDTVSISNSFDFKERLKKKIHHYEEVIYHNYKVSFLLNFLFCCTELVSIAIAIYFIFFVFGGNNV